MVQKSISSFFKIVPTSNTNMAKRSIAEKAGEPSSNKKQRKSKQECETTEDSAVDLQKDLEDTEPNKELQEEIKKQCAATPALHPNIGESWFEVLKPEFDKPYFKKLSEYLSVERKKSTVYPTEKNVFSWTHHCSVKDVKVVILGQDPYHGPGQAHGLCFSVQAGVPPPPSLVNMYKELETDIPGFKKPGHGYLVGWAEQGVLLLNAVLTVKAHTANAHKAQGWENFTTAVVKAVAEHNKGVVFLLWGAYAQKKVADISKSDHHLLASVHPSPLSAHRGFFGCKHFSQCNDLLKQQDMVPIDWTKLPL